MIPFDELITPVSEEQFLERFLTNLETLKLKARSWRPGGFFRSVLRVLAATCASFSDFQVRFTKSGFLELAEGDWLTWVAYYVYGVERPGDTFASGKVTLTNLGGGDYDFIDRQFRVLNPTTKKAYTNVGGFHLGPLGEVTIDVIAVEIGSDSSSAAAAISDVETQYVDEIECTNAAPVVGSDAMPDPDLQQLCLDSLGARSVFGPRGAYRYAIRSAKREDGTAVNINRSSVSPFSSTGRVTMFAASPSGVPAADDITAARGNVELLARPDTVTTTLDACTAQTVTRSLTIWARSQPGLKAADITALAQKKLVALQREYPIGGLRKTTSQGYFLADTLEGQVQGAHPAIFDVEGVGSDVAMDAGAVVVLAVTIAAVHIVDTEVH